MYTLALLMSHPLSARQTQTTFPACANTCIDNTDTGGCALTDTLCLCQNQDFLYSVVVCSYTDCTTVDDTQASYDALNTTCAQVGVSID
ncbi:hypothetical protein BDQ17DRAFT_1355004 [Cyathus striatus]|nr:hypothetical protein BDQ17DRAFT_1355004 [Cyathus striatus]